MFKAITILASLLICAVAHSHGIDHARELSSRHDFTAAATELEEVLKQHPEHGQAWLSLASVSLIQGNIERAIEACREAAKFVDPIASLACQGRISLAAGQPQPTLNKLKGLLELSAYTRRTDPLVAWAYAVAAELAALTPDHDLADRFFIRAINLRQPPQVKVAYADHLIRTQRISEVLNIEPPKSSLAFELRRIQAQQSRDSGHTEAKRIAHLDRQFRRALRQGDFEHAREFAYFYLFIKPNAELALLAARENFALQKEPEDIKLLEIASTHTS